MAILGGAGNPVGGSFTGGAQALETILEGEAKGHVYAFSGNVLSIAGLAFTDLLSFKTGQTYAVGNLISCGATDIANPSQGAHSLTQIEYNGVNVGLIKLESGKEGMQAYANVPLLIPPNTEVVISIAAESAGWNCSASFVGQRFR